MGVCLGTGVDVCETWFGFFLVLFLGFIIESWGLFL